MIWVRANFPAGHLAGRNRPTRRGSIRRILETFPEVQLVSSQTGRNDSGTDPYGPNRNEFFVALNPYDTWPDGHAQGRSGGPDLGESCATQIPGAAFSLTQPIIDNVTEAVTGSPADLAVIISGPDLRAPARAGRRRRSTCCAQCRAPPIRSIEQEADQAQLRIRIDRQSVARYGINVRDVQDVIEMAIGGKPVSTVFEGEKRFDVTVRYSRSRRAPTPTPSATSWCPPTTAAACRFRNWPTSRW